MSIPFRPDEIKAIRIVELNSDGTTNVIDGNTLIECCIEEFNAEQNIREAEDVDIASANSDCDIRYKRKAKLYGYNITLSVRKNYPELENILLGNPLNFNGVNVAGEQDTDFVCKFVSLEVVMSPAGGDCEDENSLRGWRLFPKVGYWAKTSSDVAISSSREIPTITYTGFAEFNANFDDPFGQWLTTTPAPAWTANAVSAKYLTSDWVTPTCVNNTGSDLVATSTLIP